MASCESQTESFLDKEQGYVLIAIKQEQNMKRIVAFISPVEAVDAQEPSTDSSRLTGHSQDQKTPSYWEKEGTVKFEAVVSDAQLKPIVDALLVTQETKKVAESLICELLQHELQLHSEDSEGLFNAILSNVERELLSQTYQECNRVKIKTAARLGIDRNTLHKKLQKHGLIDYENG